MHGNREWQGQSLDTTYVILHTLQHKSTAAFNIFLLSF